MRLVQNVGQASLADRSGDVEQESGKNTPQFERNWFSPHVGRLSGPDLFNNFSSLNKNSEVPVEVAMVEGDILIEKQTPSCFAFTNLQLILKQLGIDGLLVGGNSTSGCVRATIVDGEGLGYKMQLIEEASFDRIELSHAAAVFDMQFKYCDVISADEALAQIESLKATARAA